MARIKIRIHSFVREVSFQLEQCLQLPFGVPMNADLPFAGGEFVEGKGFIHFVGSHFKLNVTTGKGHYGDEIHIDALSAAIFFQSAWKAEQWITNLKLYAGPVDWRFENEKLRFKLSAESFERLEMNASNRRNDLPEYEWGDEPFIQE